MGLLILCSSLIGRCRRVKQRRSVLASRVLLLSRLKIISELKPWAAIEGLTDQIGMGFCRFSSRVCRRTEWLRGI